MSDVAATSLLKGAGKAGRRFVTEVAVSSIATLCVTLAFSSWLRQDLSGPQDLSRARSGGEVSSPVAPAVIRSLSSTPSGSAPPQVRVIEIAPQATASARLQATQPAPEASDKPMIVAGASPSASASASASTSTSASPSVPAATPPRNRPSHTPKVVIAKPKDVSPSCITACPGQVTLAAASALDALPQLDLPPQPATRAASQPDRSRSLFGVPVPVLALPSVIMHSARPVVQGAGAVTDLLTGLAARL
ncbi:hypothetical protein SAMN05519104_6097 [Rhizobiales bacterium GAS188]|nr:hypothetical protein SAMN05519104_6097 [Rhizobiales bacterium GAS188]